MSETPQQQSNADEENISSQLPDKNLESQGNPPTETVTATSIEPEVVSNPDVTVEAVTNSESETTPPQVPELDVVPETGVPSPLETLALADKLIEISSQRDAFQSQYLRIAADFDNFRKRSSKEKEDIEVQVKCSTITELLSVVDNFERARTQIKPQNDGEMGIHKSYQGVYKQLVESLKRIGVSPMRPEGQQFDPNLHEAVMRQPTEEHPEGTVIEELQRGYYLGDRILRHSLVKVAAPPEQLSVEDATGFDPAES
jgi:molecular chaperone GrpE